MSKLTPMMQQYLDIKKQYEDALLFFRLGDFYELFFQDAEIASRELEITLTGRECGQEERAPMCGVPHHSVDGYIDRLIAKGYRVALCEQVEDASQAVGIVKRDVVRVVTPGTVMDTHFIEEKRNNYLMALYGASEGWGISYGDLTTGELKTTQLKGRNTAQRLKDEVTKIQPREIIYFIEEGEEEKKQCFLSLKQVFDHVVNIRPGWCFENAQAVTRLQNHFQILTPEGLGLSLSHLGINATGALLEYLGATQKRALTHLNQLQVYHLTESMMLDLTTRSNLELTETLRTKSRKGSLLWVLDKTQTAMGGRLLRKWIESPLLSLEKINERLDAVEAFKEELLLRSQLKEDLKRVYDMERLAGKIAYGSATPKDLSALKNSLGQIPLIRIRLQASGGLLKQLYDQLDPLEDVAGLIQEALVDDPPLTLKDGGIIRPGYHPEVDDLLAATRNGKQWIASLEATERERTGIKNLKVGFNKVFGYYLEVTQSYLKLVPETYIRKQTLANCERYITPELKEMEAKMLGAEERIIALEQQLFLQLRERVGQEIKRLQQTAQAVAAVDCLNAFAEAAAENRYVKPVMVQGDSIEIENGRHPVVEKMLGNDSFVQNYTRLDQENHQIAVITGPNMAGKSTYMRQVAIIVLMAQIGSFIPADGGTIGIVDRIFTRVGASDDLSQGQSTFMVEMTEMANILNSATSESLLILDEIGRGTSTFDGLSIAWSVIEYLSRVIRAKTLFSTHYHELTELEGQIDGVKNYRVAVQEQGEDIIFLRKVVEGSADQSYGIQVARLAGLPPVVIGRAKEILRQLEAYDIAHPEVAAASFQQMDMESLYRQSILGELKALDLGNTTPMEALNYLFDLQKKLKQLS